MRIYIYIYIYRYKDNVTIKLTNLVVCIKVMMPSGCCQLNLHYHVCAGVSNSVCLDLRYTDISIRSLWSFFISCIRVKSQALRSLLSTTSCPWFKMIQKVAEVFLIFHFFKHHNTSQHSVFIVSTDFMHSVCPNIWHN